MRNQNAVKAVPSADELPAANTVKTGTIEAAAVLKALKVKATPNVMTAEAGAVVCGNTIWLPACEDLRRLCQGVIDSVDEHRHLRAGLVLLILRQKGSDADTVAKGGQVIAGKGIKASPQMRLMSRIGRGLKNPADFVVWLNLTWLEHVGAISQDSDDGGLWKLTREPELLGKVFALLDHELCHCGAKIVGEFVAPGNVAAVVEELGPRHLSTERHIVDEYGDVLVRSYKKPEVGEYVYCGRKHDLEEFNGVICRHGAWSPNLTALVDEIAENRMPLFDGTGGRGDE